jgi:SsrA-binding protein
MAAATKGKSGLIAHGVAAQNRKARFDYAIKSTLEAGIVLRGPEVKSLRLGRATLSEAWAGEREGEMFLFNAYIPEYQGGVLSRFEPRAPRKLLGLGEGRKKSDKRAAIATRDWQRDKARLLRNRG